MKKVIYILFILILITACSKVVNNKEQAVILKNEKKVTLDIMVTNKLLYDIAKAVVQDKHFVEYMFKTKEEQGSFIFSDDSLSNISKQDLFMYAGAGFEPWITEFLDKINKNRVVTINASRGTKLINYSKEIKYKDTVLRENPYYWMSLDNYKIVALNIKNAITDKDPQNREFYEENFSLYIKDIEKLQEEEKAVMEKLKEYTFLVDGEELEYYLKYNNFKWIKISKEENQTLEMQKENAEKLEKKIKETKNVVFLYDTPEKLKWSAELIAKYNIKTAEVLVYKNNFNYKEMMIYNIENIKKAM